MKKFVFLLAALASFSSFAGEQYLGTIDATTSSKTNATATTPFCIPQMAKITVQCDAAAYVATDQATATTTNGVKVSADQAFPTSVGSAKVTVSSVRCAQVAIILSTGTANCRFFERSGRE